MADELTPQQQALAAAEEALRSGRHMLETMLTTMLGVGYEVPPNSRAVKVLAEMKAAQDKARASLYGGK